MTITKKKELKLRSKFSALKNAATKSIENWLREKRDLDLCRDCPSDIRGLCCYASVRIETPNKNLCVNKCTAHLRENCEIAKKGNLPRKCKKAYNIILINQPCKYLNLETNLCKIFDNRFFTNRGCQTIRNASKKKYLALPVGCVYLRGRKKKKYDAYMPKIYYESVKDELCAYSRLSFELMDSSPHNIVRSY